MENEGDSLGTVCVCVHVEKPMTRRKGNEHMAVCVCLYQCLIAGTSARAGCPYNSEVSSRYGT